MSTYMLHGGRRGATARPGSRAIPRKSVAGVRRGIARAGAARGACRQTATRLRRQRHDAVRGRGSPRPAGLDRAADAAPTWSTLSSSGSPRDRPLEPGLNRFEVEVSDARPRAAVGTASASTTAVAAGVLQGPPRGRAEPGRGNGRRILAGYRRTAGNRGPGASAARGRAGAAGGRWRGRRRGPPPRTAASTPLSPGSSSWRGCGGAKSAPSGGPTSTTRRTAMGCWSPSIAGRRIRTLRAPRAQRARIASCRSRRRWRGCGSRQRPAPPASSG